MKASHFDLLLELYPLSLPDSERHALLDEFRHLAVVRAFCRGAQDIPLPDGVEVDPS